MPNQALSDQGVMLWLIVLFPLLGSVVTALFGYRLLKGASHWPIWVALAMSFFYSIINLVDVGSTGVRAAYEWIAAGDFRISMVLRSDSLTAIMLVTVTFVGLLVAIYSRGYLK